MYVYTCGGVGVRRYMYVCVCIEKEREGFVCMHANNGITVYNILYVCIYLCLYSYV